MATFIKIEEDKLKEHINSQLGKLKGVIKNKARLAYKILIRKFKQRAIQSATALVLQRLSPSLCDDTSDIAKGTEQVADFINGVGDVANKLTQTAGKVLGAITKMLKIVEIIVNLPIPTSVPPGIGITISVPLKLEA